ncbi:MAG TPA: FAD-dependent oxidoreductase [Caldilineaceae bacterium]|nr:FAD-dependent oxidoreductase [Caldilineaceae bacterium]
MTAPFVIVGGDAAGMSAASKIKRLQPDAQVIVFEQNRHISYSACGIPYWLGGVVPSDRQLIVLTPEVARQRRGIDVRLHHRVASIDLARQTVSGIQTDTGTAFEQPYAALLIATGARPVRPPIAGVDLPGVFTLRSLSDGQRIHAFLEQHAPQRAAIIGGGYIGMEMVEAFRARGMEVHVLELLPQLMPNFDPEMVEPVAAHLIEKSVAVRTGVQVRAIEQGPGELYVVTDAPDSPLPVDLVLLATGVRPNSELAEAAGLRLSVQGAIAIDDHMRTSAPAVYAAGDCAAHHHLALDGPAWIPLATSANKGGRIAGENMAGGDASFPGILGTAVVKVFAYTMATTGLTESEARASGQFGEAGEHVGSALIENPDKAGYWPDAETLKVKLIFDRRNGRALGGQLVGKAGVNKRIDILAAAITARMTVMDIALLDLSYAPPYSPTYDPIQICASVAQREVTGRD